MPCKDTSAEIIINLDTNDCLVHFAFSKITCDKKIGGGTGFAPFEREDGGVANVPRGGEIRLAHP